MRNAWLILALFSFCFVSCKDETPQPFNKDISGTYAVNIHYHDDWFVSQSAHGNEDSVYNSSLQIIQLSTDTLVILYPDVSGGTRQWNLTRGAVNNDSIVYLLPYGYDYLNAGMTYYLNNNTIKMNTIEKTNPSGGGHNITYHITTL